MQTIGMLIPAACLILLAVWQSISIPAAVSFMVATVGVSGFTGSGFGVNHMDISPKYAGVLMGLTNSFGTIHGIVGVMLTGWILKRTDSWPLVFLIAAGIYVFAAIFYVLFARATVCIE